MGATRTCVELVTRYVQTLAHFGVIWAANRSTLSRLEGARQNLHTHAQSDENTRREREYKRHAGPKNANLLKKNILDHTARVFLKCARARKIQFSFAKCARSLQLCSSRCRWQLKVCVYNRRPNEIARSAAHTRQFVCLATRRGADSPHLRTISIRWHTRSFVTASSIT